MGKKVYILTAQSFYDTSEYSVTSFDYMVSRHDTKEEAEAAYEERSEWAESPMSIYELDEETDQEEIETLKNNRNLP